MCRKCNLITCVKYYRNDTEEVIENNLKTFNSFKSCLSKKL